MNNSRPPLKCRKCGFVRQDTAAQTPQLACPQCGAIYAKVDEALRLRADTDNPSSIEPPRRVRPGKLLALAALGLLLVLLAVGGPLSGEYGPRNRSTNTIPTLVNALGEGWVRLYMGLAVVLIMVMVWRTRYEVEHRHSAEELAALRRVRQRRRYRFMLGLLGLGALFMAARVLFAGSAEDAAYPPDWPQIAKPFWPWACPDLSGRYRTLPIAIQRQAPGGAFVRQPFGTGVTGALGEVEVAVSGPAADGLKVSVAAWRPTVFRKPKCHDGWVLLGEEGRTALLDWGSGAYAEEAWALSADGRLIGRQTVHSTSSIFGWGDVRVGSYAYQKYYFMQLPPVPRDGAPGKP